jgi:hypothetical protein
VESELVQVQRFERARFEWHPDNPADFRVLLGRLCATLLNGQTTPEQLPEVNQVQLYFVVLDDEGASDLIVDKWLQRYRREKRYSAPATAGEKRGADGERSVLAHEPDCADISAASGRFDLQISSRPEVTIFHLETP